MKKKKKHEGAPVHLTLYEYNSKGNHWAVFVSLVTRAVLFKESDASMNTNKASDHKIYVSIHVYIYYVVIFCLSFQNNPQYLDPSYKMDLDFWELFWIRPI